MWTVYRGLEDRRSGGRLGDNVGLVFGRLFNLLLSLSHLLPLPDSSILLDHVPSSEVNCLTSMLDMSFSKFISDVYSPSFLD